MKKELVICFPLKGWKLTLGRRKCVPWLGCLSGFGGGVEEGETPTEAQVREFLEEAGAIIEEKDLIPVGIIHLKLAGKECLLHVYCIEKWEGEIRETDEMSPEEFPIWDIPTEGMIKGDELWLPWALAGYWFEAELVRGADLDRIGSFRFIRFWFRDWS